MDILTMKYFMIWSERMDDENGSHIYNIKYISADSKDNVVEYLKHSHTYKEYEYIEFGYYSVKNMYDEITEEKYNEHKQKYTITPELLHELKNTTSFIKELVTERNKLKGAIHNITCKLSKQYDKINALPIESRETI